jgi:hypothetical protein
MAGPPIPVLPPIIWTPFVNPGTGELTPTALGVIQQIWTAAFGLGGITPGVLLLGSKSGINFNISGDNEIPLALPSGAIGWRPIVGLIFGTSGSFSHAQAGLYSLPFTQGTTLIGQTALSGITATGFNTTGAVTTFTPGLTTIWNYSTLYLNVGTAQGAASQGNFYLYGYPVY